MLQRTRLDNTLVYAISYRIMLTYLQYRKCIKFEQAKYIDYKYRFIRKYTALVICTISTDIALGNVPKPQV